MDLKEVGILGPDIGDHWYYRAKALALESYLRDVAFTSVLDVGAGSGYFSRHLLRNTGARVAYCVDPNYPGESAESVAGKELFFVRKVVRSEADLVLLMDVVEHVDDDSAIIREYAQMCPENATFLISVPAFQWLWSTHDDFLGHRRRYNLGTLEAAVMRAGLRVCSCNYYFGAIFPMAAMVRLIRRFTRSGGSATTDLHRHNRFTNAALLALCRMELPLLRHNRWFGLSAFCLARRR